MLCFFCPPHVYQWAHITETHLCIVQQSSTTPQRTSSKVIMQLLQHLSNKHVLFIHWGKCYTSLSCFSSQTSVPWPLTLHFSPEPWLSPFCHCLQLCPVHYITKEPSNFECCFHLQPSRYVWTVILALGQKAYSINNTTVHLNSICGSWIKSLCVGFVLELNLTMQGEGKGYSPKSINDLLCFKQVWWKK